MTKKNYIQPTFEIADVLAINTVLSESNPWKDPKADTGDAIMY